MSTRVIPNTFIALSDFHGYDWPLDKVKDYYLNEYDKIYILGDATDRGRDGRGTGGVELLFQIKELSEKYPGRVIYVPGNHDDFLYQYATEENEFSYRSLKASGGSETIRDIDYLRENDIEKLDELITWLGNLPLQRRHEMNGKKYAFAHAFFNQIVYDYMPNLSLKHLNEVKHENINLYKHLFNILWFRKDRNTYNVNHVPTDVKVVIGHTPEKFREGVDLNLKDNNGNTIEVACVDGGIAYGGDMIKFDGETNKTQFFMHNDTSIHGDDYFISPNNTTYGLVRDYIIQDSSTDYFIDGMSNEEILASQEKINVKK